MTELTTRSVLKSMRGYPRHPRRTGRVPTAPRSPWERNLVRGILSARISALSVARGAGKSSISPQSLARSFEHLVETPPAGRRGLRSVQFRPRENHPGPRQRVPGRQTTEPPDVPNPRHFYPIEFYPPRNRRGLQVYKLRSKESARPCSRPYSYAMSPPSWLDTRANAMWAALKTESWEDTRLSGGLPRYAPKR